MFTEPPSGVTGNAIHLDSPLITEIRLDSNPFHSRYSIILEFHYASSETVSTWAAYNAIGAENLKSFYNTLVIPFKAPTHSI